MNRGRRSPQMTLFPFLSILACVIGTLTLLIAGLAAGAVGDGKLNELVRLRDETRHSEEEATRVADEIDQATALAEELARARAELERHQREHDRSKAEERELIALLARLDRLRQELAERQREQEELRGNEESLRGEVEERERLADTIVLEPSGGGRNLTPRFVECTKAGLVLDPDQPSARRIRIPFGAIESSPALTAMLRQVKARTGWSVVFLIRPGGVKAYDRAYLVAAKSDAPFGALPVPGKKNLDFRLFGKNGGVR